MCRDMTEKCITCEACTASGNHHCVVCSNVVHSGIAPFQCLGSTQPEYCSFASATEGEEDKSICARCLNKAVDTGAVHPSGGSWKIPSDHDLTKSYFTFEVSVLMLLTPYLTM
jgi:hypothetical protein